MKKIQKRNSYLSILLLFTIIMLTACNTNTLSTKDTTSETKISYFEEKQELLNHWIIFFDSMETMYNQVHLVFDYAKAFTNDNTWDSLQKARSACSTIKINLKKLPIPEFTMTDEQCKLLENAGIEVDVIRTEYFNFTSEINLELDTLNTLEALLNNDVFFSSNISVLDDWINENRNVLIDKSEYFCLLSNYLLLQLGEIETDFWEQIPQKYPHMSMGYTTWSDNSVLLMENGMLVLNRYEERFIKMNEILGTADYTLLLAKEAIETGNLEHLINEMHIVSGIPAYCPTPEWLLDNTTYYYLITDANTQEKRMIETKEEFAQTPTGCLIKTQNVTKEEVEAYGNRLKEWNLNPTVQWKEEKQKCELFVLIGQCQMLITWTPEETTIYLTVPIVCLIPELYLTALLSK